MAVNQGSRNGAGSSAGGKTDRQTGNISREQERNVLGDKAELQCVKAGLQFLKAGLRCLKTELQCVKAGLRCLKAELQCA